MPLPSGLIVLIDCGGAVPSKSCCQFWVSRSSRLSSVPAGLYVIRSLRDTSGLWKACGRYLSSQESSAGFSLWDTRGDDCVGAEIEIWNRESVNVKEWQMYMASEYRDSIMESRSLRKQIVIGRGGGAVRHE